MATKQDYKIDGVYGLTNVAALAVSIINDEHIAWRIAVLDSEKLGRWHKVKIYYPPRGRAYFMYGPWRIHLDEVMRV